MIESSEIDSRVGTSLNPAQLAAVTHSEGPLLVLAGAGSGKTRVLTHRIAHLVSTGAARPNQILAVTFTNKAADEMKHRLRALLHDRADGLWVSTFHSACLRILRRHAKLLGFQNDFVVYDDSDSSSVMKKLMKELNITDKKITPSYVLGCIDRWKNEWIDPTKAASIKGSYNLSLAAELYDKYQCALLKAQAMDFGDLLCKALDLFHLHPDILELYRYHLHYILVDEFQDTNKVQYNLMKLLAEPRGNILVVGDDDQSIYSFRGAKVSTIINFDKDFAGTKTVILDQNYRSTGSILRAANAVIRKNSHRKEKNLWTSDDDGEPISLYVGEDEGDEADFIAQRIADYAARFSTPYSSLAVFYRTNAQSRAIEDSLVAAGIPYKIFGGLKFYDRKEVKDIIAYLRILINPFDNQSVSRVINTPPRGIGSSAVAQLESFATSQGISMIDSARAIASQSKAVARFVALYDDLREKASSIPLSSLIQEIVETSGYRARLESIGDDEAQSRIENLVELQAVASQYNLAGDTHLETIGTFLDKAALSSSADLPRDDQGQSAGAVSLTTLHLAKGLEFPVVFLTGLEEGLIPHYRSLEDPAAIEEERRLCYVGITRAMKKLFLTRCVHREMFSAGSGFGSTGSYRMASRFLRDIPSEVVEAVTEGSVLNAARYETIEVDDAGFRPSRLSSKSAINAFPAGSFQQGSSQRALLHQWNPNETSGNTAKAAARSLLQSADTIEQTDSRPLLAPDELSISLRVFHPSFGAGTVTKIDGDLEKKPNNVRVTVVFDNNKEAKKLLLHFARLRAL